MSSIYAVDDEKSKSETDVDPEARPYTYDDVLRKLGEFGRYQKRIYFLLCLSVVPCAFHKLAGVFLNAAPDHRCRMPYESNNATFIYNSSLIEEEDNATNWYSHGDSSKPWSKCQRLEGNLTVDCNEWIFDTTKYTSSSVIEFSLVCNRAWLQATADAMFMIGVLLGSYIFGDLSDRFGRKPTFIISLILQLISGLLTALAPEYFTFVLGRIFVGATTSGVFLVAYVIAMEMVGPTKRLFAGVIVHMFFSTGFLLIAAIAYMTTQHSWRIFQIVISLFPGFFLLSYWWIIPESSRWLASKGRHKEAKLILHNAAKENGATIPESILDSLMSGKGKKGEDVKENKSNLMDLMRHKSLRRRSLNIFFNWFVNSLVYYGLSWSTNDLGGNDYLNFCLSGIMEYPGYGILLFTLNRFGRRFTLCGALLVSGTALLLTAFVPPDMNWLTITLAMIGKMAITSSYGTVYVFSTEQFPTVIRNVALGAASMSARIGGILAPYMKLLTGIWKPLPLLIFGALAFVAGGLTLFMPETLNRTLPETIEEGEAFEKNEPSKPAAKTSGFELSTIAE